MAFSIKDRTERTLSEINVTPLVDVVLVLLIIFMVTAPMMQSGVEIDLPKTDMPVKETEERWIVTVKAAAPAPQVFINDTPVLPELLDKRLQELLFGVADPAVHLRADRSVEYGYVLYVMGKIKKAGVERVGLVTEKGVPDYERRTR